MMSFVKFIENKLIIYRKKIIGNINNKKKLTIDIIISSVSQHDMRYHLGFLDFWKSLVSDQIPTSTGKVGVLCPE